MPFDTIFGMGERQRILKNKRRMRLYGLVAAAGLVLFGALLLGINILTSDEPVERVATPASVPDPEELGRAAQQEAAFMAKARQAAAEAEKKTEDAAPRASNTEPQPAVPPDTTMYLTIPKLGLQDIPVLEGSSEAVLSQGVGHLPGTGYPWAEGSNTYIAGHRLGYPGTVSDHVFWDLPSLVAGDEVILEDSLGQTYTYRVSEILEVSPYDLSVTGSTGSDIVSLQTCIETYGDYWTAGPNWLARYIVRAERV
jgi:LPXTG-site transpeptidase (sortase) family protein